jgi:hypothetical protein
MQEHVGNITFANDGEVEFENASVEINNVELFGDIRIAFTSFISLHICPSLW